MVSVKALLLLCWQWQCIAGAALNIGDGTNRASILTAAGDVAAQLRHLFNNATYTLNIATAGVQWQSGVAIDALIHYSWATGDTTYNAFIDAALEHWSANSNGCAFDFGSGNDDTLWWVLAVMSAAEINLNGKRSVWQNYAISTWTAMLGRRITSNLCRGGLPWHTAASSAANEKSYVGTIGNAQYMQLSARLALLVGDAKYADQADASWNFLADNVFIYADGAAWKSYDGYDVNLGGACSPRSDVGGEQRQWAYHIGMLLFGATMMDKVRPGDGAGWSARAHGLLDTALTFYPGGSYVEPSCGAACNDDQKTFGALLTRAMWDAAALDGSMSAGVRGVMLPWGQTAAGTCTDAADSMCGGSFFGTITALEVLSGLARGSNF